MEKKTLEELMTLANQSLQYDMDLRMVLEFPNGASITMSLEDEPSSTVVIWYRDNSGMKMVERKHRPSFDPGELCRYWGLNPESTDWFIDYMTFLQLDEFEDRIKKLRKNLSPYMED